MIVACTSGAASTGGLSVVEGSVCWFRRQTCRPEFLRHRFLEGEDLLLPPVEKIFLPLEEREGGVGRALGWPPCLAVSSLA